MKILKRFTSLLQDKFKSLSISLIPDDVKKFTYIYKKKYWKSGKDGSLSGSGSDKKASKNLVNGLNNFIRENTIQSILDVPCGDWTWMSEVRLQNLEYTGGDIVEDIINNNRVKYSRDNVSFRKINLMDDDLISCDLLIVRDLLVHLKNKDILKCLENIKKYDIKYIGLTHYPNTKYNKNTFWGDRWRPLNMLKEPFNIFQPDYILSDASNDGGVDENRVLAIWKKNNFKDHTKQ